MAAVDGVRISAPLIARGDMVHAVIASIKAPIDAPSLDEGVPKAPHIVGDALDVARCVIVESVGRPGVPPNTIPFYQWNCARLAPLTRPFMVERIKHSDGASWLALLGEGEPITASRISRAAPMRRSQDTSRQTFAIASGPRRWR